ncbi:MAG: DUF3577 domain-containing protein [Marinagarivorans sp.]|nr:DUF3577 domain-containing protein [Marinagarivorans sp.]
MSNTNKKTAFFNVHTEALGYLSKLEERNGKNGSFTIVTFCMLEGTPDNPENVFVSLTVACESSKALLEQYAESINNKTTVFAGLRLANLRATPFMYPSSSQKAGELGVNYSGKLIKTLYLKVGDFIVKQTENRPAQALPKKNTQPAATVAKASAAPSSEALPLMVKLSKSDPNFDITKQRLLDDGYRWHTGNSAWMLKAVAAGNASEDDLQRNGYTFNGEFYVCNFPTSNQAKSGYARPNAQA